MGVIEENVHSIEKCCRMIKAQTKLLAKHLGNEEHLFVDTYNRLADRILELYETEKEQKNIEIHSDYVT